jgi:hypothetical protein
MFSVRVVLVTDEYVVLFFYFYFPKSTWYFKGMPTAEFKVSICFVLNLWGFSFLFIFFFIYVKFSMRYV